MSEVLNHELLDSDVYYVGHYLDEKGTQGLAQSWSLDGIFTTLEEASANTPDQHFIVRIPINTLLPDQLLLPKQSWWVINGELIRSENFLEE